MSSSSVFALPSSSFVPLHSTNTEYPQVPSLVMPPRSTLNLSSESPPSPFIPPGSLLFTNYDDFDDEDTELAFNAKQTTQLPSQNSERSTPPWVLASRKLHVHKKPIDSQFIAYMADLRRQTDGISSTSSTPRTSLALLGSPMSIASSVFSPSFSVASPLPAVEFLPILVFTDEMFEEFM
jgi:hypothetical protein